MCKVVDCAAEMLRSTPERVCRDAPATLLLAPSVKAALDRDWSDPEQKASAVKALVIEPEELKDWLAANLAQELKKPPITPTRRPSPDGYAATSRGSSARKTDREADRGFVADLHRRGITSAPLRNVKSPGAQVALSLQ